MTILDEIAEKTKIRVEKAKLLHPLVKLKEDIKSLTTCYLLPATCNLPFKQALSSPGLSFICEVKKASPSKGIIAEDFPYLEIARDYEEGGAAAISVLTEPEYFLGSDKYLQEISRAVNIPTLRKDFTIDSYQIYEAKLLGAKAVLLICALLDTKTVAEYINIAAELDLDALVEIHNELELEQAVQAGAKIIGINNRDLKTFKVDINASAALRNKIPAGILTVAESGIKSPEETRHLQNLGFDAVLIGETLMRSPDRKELLKILTQSTQSYAK